MEEFVTALVCANIPLEKAERLRPFLRKHCKQGGTVPGPDQLRCEYLPRVFQKHVTNLKKKVAGEKVIIIVDETTDSREKAVLNILVWLKDGSCLLVDLVYPDAVNSLMDTGAKLCHSMMYTFGYRRNVVLQDVHSLLVQVYAFYSTSRSYFPICKGPPSIRPCFASVLLALPVPQARRSRHQDISSIPLTYRQTVRLVCYL